MKLKRLILVGLFLSTMIHAQDEMSLDPNDIPLPADPALDVPMDNSLTLPNLDEPPPSVDPNLTPDSMAPMPPQVTTPAETLTPQAIEEVKPAKPTPSNLEVKGDNDGEAVRKEDRFNQAYKKFHKDSTQNWEKVVGKRTSDTYIVNKGDTLWDISGTLFGDPFYWPKIWSLNKDMIYNPHVIFPDMKIKFYQGDSKAAPTLATDNNQDKTPTPGAPEEKKEVVEAPTPDPTPTAPNAPVGDEKPKDRMVTTRLRKLPKYFRDKEISVQKEVEIKVEELQLAANEPSIAFEFYIAEQPLTSMGEIVEVRHDFKSAGEAQFVFVKFNAQPEGIYTVLKPAKKIKDSKGDPIELELYEVEGEVKVLGRVNGGENVYRSEVTRTTSLVSRGSFLVPGRIKGFKISDSSAETTANKGRIIGNLNAYGIVGQGTFVVVNQGAQSGYQPGMRLPIFEDIEGRNPLSLVKENPQKVGTLTIVDSTTNFSIAYVTRVVDRVEVNDLVAMADGGEFAPTSAKAEDSGELDSGSGNVENIEEVPPTEAPVEEF